MGTVHDARTVRPEEYVHPELAELGAERTAKAVTRYAAAATRISIGFIFLWAFADKALATLPVVRKFPILR